MKWIFWRNDELADAHISESYTEWVYLSPFVKCVRLKGDEEVIPDNIRRFLSPDRESIFYAISETTEDVGQSTWRVREAIRFHILQGIMIDVDNDVMLSAGDTIDYPPLQPIVTIVTEEVHLLFTVFPKLF